METFETESQSEQRMDISLEQSNEPQLILDEEIKDYLNSSSKWAKFLSIIGFIGVGFMFLGSLFLMIVGGTLGSASMSYGVSPNLMGFLYFIFAVLYIFPIYYLYQFSTGISKGLKLNSQENIKEGFKNLKAQFKYLGIMTIVIISLYFLIFIFGMIAVAFR